jgi:amino acid transporter
MVGEPRDRTAYSMAIVGLGVALALLLAGICWIAVQNSSPDVSDVFTHRCPLEASSCRPVLYGHTATSNTSIPEGLWITLAALVGVLTGTLISFSQPVSQLRSKLPKWEKGRKRTQASIAAIGVAVALFVVVAVVIPPLLFAIAGLLLGLLIPSPARRD